MTLLPAALLATFAPQAAPSAALIASSLLFAGCLDALRGAALLRGLGASVPPVTRLSCRRPGQVGITFTYPPHLGGRRLHVALDLPPEAGAQNPTLDCVLPRDAARALVAWPCVPAARGLYRVRLAACETASPWGLWQAVRRLPLSGELRIFPDLHQERRKVPAVFLRRGGAGVHLHRQTGKGREFEKLREYVPGDDVGDIHWKATARRRFPVTKMFQLERTQEAYVVLDVSRLSGRPLDDAESRTVLEQYIRSALTLVLAAERLGDRCGLIVFHRTVTGFLPAGSGKRHFSACRNALYNAATEPVSPDFHELFSFIRTRVPKRALLLFLTHLDSPALAEPFLQAARLIARQHLLAVPLLTPREARPILSGTPPAELDDAWRRLAGHLQWRQLHELQRQLRTCGIRSSLAASENATAELVAHYLNVKERQLL